MKLNIKILIIFTCAFISVISQTNCAICSDNIPVAPNQIRTGAATQPQQLQESQESTSLTSQPSSIPAADKNSGQTSNNGFLSAFANMAKTLLNVIIAIITAAGLIVLYRRFKSKISLPSKPKNKNSQDYENTMPTNVSEAVVSFVRRKIKRTS